MEMESFMDELLNFSIPEVEVDNDEGEVQSPRKITRRETETDTGVVEEEELEWISNKDAFPVIETFVGILPSEHFSIASPKREAKQLSPVSILETSITTTTSSSSSGVNESMASSTATMMSCCIGFNVPVKPRSKRRRTGRKDLNNLWTWNNEQGGRPQKRKKASDAAAVDMGRKCQHCGVDNTPQWRAGPLGPKTLCNACGVRYKSGRLVPEYRPVNSPTFKAELHSNSHRKILEMRRQFMS